MKTIVTMLLLLAGCGLCHAQLGKVETLPQKPPATGIGEVIKRRQMQRPADAIEKVTNLGDGLLEITRADGRTEVQPIRYVVQPDSVKSAVDVALSRQRLERSAYAAAQLDTDATSDEKVAALEALREETEKGGTGIGAVLLAAAAGAAAGLGLGRKTEGGK